MTRPHVEGLTRPTHLGFRLSTRRRARRWLHLHGHHWFCRVVVEKVQVDTKYDFSPEYLVGTHEDGTEYRLDISTFGGRSIPIYDWRAFHT